MKPKQIDVDGPSNRASSSAANFLKVKPRGDANYQMTASQLEKIIKLAQERIALTAKGESEEAIEKAIMKFALENENLKEFAETRKLEDELNEKQYGGTPLTSDDLDRLDSIHDKYRHRCERIRNQYDDRKDRKT